MGITASLPEALAEQIRDEVPTVVDIHDWFPHIIVLPADLCVPKKEISPEPGVKICWRLDTRRSCDEYEVYKDADWWFFKGNRSDLAPRTWRYATRVRCPKGMMPNTYVLSRASLIKVHRPYGYLG
jgi:hypothetical protein